MCNIVYADPDPPPPCTVLVSARSDYEMDPELRRAEALFLKHFYSGAKRFLSVSLETVLKFLLVLMRPLLVRMRLSETETALS